jgi:hypothetical protein
VSDEEVALCAFARKRRLLAGGCRHYELLEQ